MNKIYKSFLKSKYFSTKYKKYFDIYDLLFKRFVNKRITIIAPLLLNSIRINHEIQVKNDIIGVNITTGESNPSIQIKSIEWFYPEGKTIINAGEHKFDSFDIDKFTAAQVRTLTEDANVTKTV